MRGVLLRLRTHGAGDDSGSMLTELIVSLVIFAVLSTGLLGLALTSVKTVGTNKDRETAVQLASKDLEVVRSNKITDLVQGRTTYTTIVNNETFTIAHDAEFVPLAATGSACGSSGAPSYIRMTATVSWSTMPKNSKPVTASTLVTPAVGTYDKTDGNFGVKVFDRDGNPQAGVTVTITGTSTASQVTGADGCAFFAFKDPGTYTATLTASGYVDPVGNATPSSTQSIATGTTVNTQFTFDKAALINFDVNTTSAYPAPSTMPFTVYNTAFTNTLHTRSQTVATGTVSGYYPGGGVALANGQMTGLFPSSSGYVAWAGSCKDGDPATYRQAAIAVSPGGASTSGPVNVVRYTITVNGLTSAKGWSLTANHATDSTSCTTGESYALVPITTLATATSMTFSGSLPFGTWTFTAKNANNSHTITSGNQVWPGGTTAVQTFAVTVP